jgi:NADH dehydrogenase (ubiquinone) Fe-S protein 6
MIDPPETIRTDSARVSCMGASDVAGTALGHPRVWLQIDPDIGFVDCGYCDRRFILSGGPADHSEAG